MLHSRFLFPSPLLWLRVCQYRWLEVTGTCITSCLYRNGNRDFSATCRSASATHREQWEPLDSGLPQEDPQESKLLGATVGHSLQDTCCCSTATSFDRGNEAEKVPFYVRVCPKRPTRLVLTQHPSSVAVAHPRSLIKICGYWFNK